MYSRNTQSTLATLAKETEIITMNYKETQKAAILVLGKRKDIAIARC